MKIPATTECQACGKQIGTSDYVVCRDGITSKVVSFHKRCNPAEPDLQRHHHVALKPLLIGLTPQALPLGTDSEFPTLSTRFIL